MFRRYLLSLFALTLLLGGLLLSMMPLGLLRSRLETPLFEQSVCLWVSAVVLVLIPLGNKLLKMVWSFRATAEPVPLEQLREQLLAVNQLACPVRATARRHRIILTWRNDEAPWCEVLSHRDLHHIYELRCRFDAHTHTVFLIDRIRAVDFVICPDHVKIGFARICLPFLWRRLGRPKTIDQYPSLEAYDYDFHPREIKTPVLGTILASGWNVRFSLF